MRMVINDFGVKI